MNTRIVDEDKLFDKIAQLVDFAERLEDGTEERAFREGQVEALAMIAEGQVDMEDVDNPEYPNNLFREVLHEW